MQLITYDIELLEPVLVTALDGDPNSSISYNFIPGSVLRGALIGRYKNKHGAINVINDRSLFFSHETQFLNGYVTIYDEEELEYVRSWPLPLSLRRQEAQSENESKFEAYDFAWKAQENTERFEVPFGMINQGNGQAAQIERQVNIHIQRDRSLGRSTRASGEIYNYEALAPGQTFRAHILSSLDKDDIQPIIDLLSGELHLGGSRSAGYGRVRLSIVPDALSYKQWLATRLHKQDEDKMIVTLLSDVLLRDVRGNWTSDPHELAKALGVQLVTAYPGSRPIGTFNRKWNLPLPQRTALQMGSVLVCQSPTNSQWQALENLIQAGVGEGREDGFGRLAVNWQAQSRIIFQKPEDQELESVQLSEGSNSRLVAEKMVKRIWRNQLETAVIAEANRLGRKQKRLSKSQIYRLRMKIQAAIQEVVQTQQAETGKEKSVDKKTSQNLQTYITDLSSRRSTRDQFKKTRVDGKSLLEWIQELLTRSPKKMRQVAPFAGVSAQIGDVESSWNENLTLEYNLRLIDAVLANIAKKNKQEVGNE